MATLQGRTYIVTPGCRVGLFVFRYGGYDQHSLDMLQSSYPDPGMQHKSQHVDSQKIPLGPARTRITMGSCTLIFNLNSLCWYFGTVVRQYAEACSCFFTGIVEGSLRLFYAVSTFVHTHTGISYSAIRPRLTVNL